MQLPTLTYERRLWRNGFARVAGVDEVGRGALAGPVVAAAVIFAKGKIPETLKGVRDSKQLTEARREMLYDLIVVSCTSWGVGVVSHRVIDRINISNASLLAMQKAAAKLKPVPEHLLLDGRISALQWQRVSQYNAIAHDCDRGPSAPSPFTAHVRGDSYIFSIAAASIIAKATRDRLMRKLDKKFPEYAFARHKGYGTLHHYRALQKHGPCSMHRRTFYLGE